MKVLRHEGILPKVIDRFTPDECQYVKEWDVCEVYQCDCCGEIYEDKPHKDYVCGAIYKDGPLKGERCDSTEFSPVEQIMEEE